jgi:hypothetical protein
METAMTIKKHSNARLTRKQFLQLSAAGAAGLLTGCQAAPVAAPADTAVPGTTAAGSTARPAGTKPSRTDILSRVVRTHGEGVWDGDALSPAALRRMLDASITRLTGLTGAREAWAGLFSPDDTIAIKVNAFRNSLIYTHVPLVTAVTDSLRDAGVPANQIVLYDYFTTELETAGFAINRDGDGVRCFGTDDDYTDGTDLGGEDVRLSRILDDCTALINMPVLKSHMISGITFALKNHFGSTLNPSALHYPIEEKMAALNALPQIKDRTRLIIGDILEANLEYSNSFPYWKPDYKGDSILMSFDPVAHDTVGLNILTKLLAEKGVSTESDTQMAVPCLTSAAALGLGTNTPENIELVEVTV